MYRLRKIALAFCILLFSTGCWDSKDIEQVNFIVGSAFDKAPPTTSDEKNRQKKRVQLTIQTISHQPGSSQSGQGNNQQKQYQNVSGTGDSRLEIIRQFALKTENAGVGAHLKVSVISESLLRDMNLELLLSFHARTYEVRDSCIMLIAQGSAADTLKIAADIPSFELIGISDNQYKTNRLLPPVTHGKLQNLLEANTSFAVQSVRTQNKEIKFNGGALIKGDTKKLIGILSEEEVEGLNWITGKIKGGFVKGKDPKTHGLILYEISSVKSKIIPHVKGGHVSFDVNIDTIGRLNEDWVLAGNAFSNKFIKRAEIAATEEIKRQIKQTLTKLQKTYQIDAAGFGEQLRIHYPKEWNHMKKNWDKRFSKAPIHYHVNVTIRDYMVKGRKEISK
ncbi:Ger(x)C family spore germination protein [Shimazuella sp. AN120528]|uniref:Ger(x)C family spore germination protein n=1 Tax=Shimazuella soli TaxID=1892854 RepID=UPI001F0D14D5|nr:Ger(x)C family spore germination protein [Shimazuella soli]MCH5584644.1 Ger(x)C family spore germination protein [Shimazuella soli]